MAPLLRNAPARSAAAALAAAAVLTASAACRPSRDATPSGVAADGSADVAVEVEYVAFDPGSGSPVVVLAELEGSRALPILIPIAAAQSIASEMKRIAPPRPNTHDLATSLLDGLHGRVERVTVTELRAGTYYAIMFVRTEERTLEIDARPSDAIAIALRVRAPVFVRESVLDEAGHDLDPDEAIGEVEERA